MPTPRGPSPKRATPRAGAAPAVANSRPSRPSCGQGRLPHDAVDSRPPSSRRRASSTAEHAAAAVALTTSAVVPVSASRSERAAPRSAQRLRVVVRVRPGLTQAEQQVGFRQRWRLSPDEATASVTYGAGEEDDRDEQAATQTFSFDVVCGPQSSQDAVYGHVKDTVGMAVGGGCGGVLCYGGGRSGKSHTLMNMHIGEWGILPQALNQVFVAILEKGGAVELSCSLVLDEALVDLLRTDVASSAHASTEMAVGQAGGGGAAGTLLDEMSWHPAENAREGMLLLQKAVKARNVHQLEPTRAPRISWPAPLTSWHAPCISWPAACISLNRTVCRPWQAPHSRLARHAAHPHSLSPLPLSPCSVPMPYAPPYGGRHGWRCRDPLLRTSSC